MKTILGMLLTALFISCIYTITNASAVLNSSNNGSISNQIVMPGNFPDFFCQEESSKYNAVITNQTGFARSEPDHLYFGHMHVYDYMLLPDHNATITYVLQNGTSSDLTNGDVTFFHDGGQQDHLGLKVQFSPVFNVTGGIGETMSFSASTSALHGTYWMTLPPAYCASGMVILFTVGESISSNLSIPSSFTSNMDKQTYFRTDDRLIKILGVPYNILQLTIFSDKSHMVALNDTIMIDPDGESVYWLHADNFPDNEYTVILDSQNKTSTIPFAIEPKTETVSSMPNATAYNRSNNTETQDANKISSPLQQFKSGIAANDVKCKQDLYLVIKAEDGFPACVKFSTATMLIKNGWASSDSGISSDGQRTYIIQDSSASSIPCDTVYPQSNTGIAVLYMPTNATGKLCVNYSNPNPPRSVDVRIFESQYLSKDTKDIQVLSSQDNIPQGNSTIVYTLKTSKVGFYGLTLFCYGTPLAVGYDNQSRMVTSDFPWLGQTFYCPMQTYTFHISGLSGIGVKYIPYQ